MFTELQKVYKFQLLSDWRYLCRNRINLKSRKIVLAASFSPFSPPDPRTTDRFSSGLGRSWSVEIPEIEQVAWTWCLFLSFTVPEVGTFIRSARLCFFKVILHQTGDSSVSYGRSFGTVWFTGLGVYNLTIIPSRAQKSIVLTIPVAFNLTLL